MLSALATTFMPPHHSASSLLLLLLLFACAFHGLLVHESAASTTTSNVNCERMQDYCTHVLYQHLMMTQCRYLCEPLVVAAKAVAATNNGVGGMRGSTDPDCYDRRPDLCSKWPNFCTSQFYGEEKKEEWCKQTCNLCSDQHTIAEGNEGGVAPVVVGPPAAEPSGKNGVTEQQENETDEEEDDSDDEDEKEEEEENDNESEENEEEEEETAPKNGKEEATADTETEEEEEEQTDEPPPPAEEDQDA